MSRFLLIAVYGSTIAIALAFTFAEHGNEGKTTVRKKYMDDFEPEFKVLNLNEKFSLNWHFINTNFKSAQVRRNLRPVEFDFNRDRKKKKKGEKKKALRSSIIFGELRQFNFIGNLVSSISE